MFWLVSCAIFIAFFNLFKCKSKFKKLEEDLRLQTIWNTKNSMDFLHYMQFEHENFNLIMAPFLCDLSSWMKDERSSSGYMDFLLATSFMTIRLAILIGFLVNLNKRIKYQCFNKGYFIFWFFAYWAVFTLNFVL